MDKKEVQRHNEEERDLDEGEQNPGSESHEDQFEGGKAGDGPEGGAQNGSGNLEEQLEAGKAGDGLHEGGEQHGGYHGDHLEKEGDGEDDKEGDEGEDDEIDELEDDESAKETDKDQDAAVEDQAAEKHHSPRNSLQIQEKSGTVDEVSSADIFPLCIVY